MNQRGNFKSTRLLKPSRGKVISGMEFTIFLKMPLNKKLVFVREQYQEIYGKKEWLTQRVAERATVSNQGLINLEQNKVIQPTTGTIELIAKKGYFLPPSIFLDDTNPEQLEGFFIGKVEDRNAYFDAYHLTYNEYHFLDSRYRESDQLGEDNSGDGFHIDDEGYDVITKPDGSRTLDRYSVEVVIRSFQPSSGFIAGEETVHDMKVVIAPEDLEYLKESIKRDLTYMSEKFERHKPDRKTLISKYRRKLQADQRGQFMDGGGI